MTYNLWKIAPAITKLIADKTANALSEISVAGLAFTGFLAILGLLWMLPDLMGPMCIFAHLQQ